jgi:hypothetical protein
MNVSALAVTPLEPLLPAFTRRSWDAAKNLACIRRPRSKTGLCAAKTPQRSKTGRVFQLCLCEQFTIEFRLGLGC